jgi:hypothetical protein
MEFLIQIEQCARVSNWDKDDVVNIIKAKLTGEARQFVNGRDQLTEEKVRYEVLKAALVDHFTEKLPARYHYNFLHEATQGKEESLIQFLDRDRALSLKTVRKSADPTEQCILKEETNFRLLTSFTYGMRGEAGHELQIRNPETLDQALSMATVVYKAKKMELRHRDYDTLAVKKGEKNFTNLRGYGPSWRQGGQPQGSPVRRPQGQRDRSRDRVRPPVTCFSCGRHGHIARDCGGRRKPTTKEEQRSPN